MICEEKGLKQYILKEYGSWGVMTLSYLTGLVVSGRVTPGAVAVFIAIALYINSKQAFVLWMRRRGRKSGETACCFSGTGSGRYPDAPACFTGKPGPIDAVCSWCLLPI